MSEYQNAVLRPRSLRLGSSAIGASAALGLSAALMVPGAAFAQQQNEEELATVKVEDTAIDPNPNAQLGVPYKARTSGDERHSRPLAETPQVISVLTRAQIEDSGYNDLARILDAQPGITVGTGENGNAFGDRYIIRGQEARSDVFVDGLRDPGMTTRESFAVEQLEISKGPNSSFAGRGTAGGAINAITKQPTLADEFGKLSVGLGKDRFVRTTADLNYSLSNTFAVRANALYAYEYVPDRKPADRERTGGAISALFSPDEKLSITLDYYGLRAEDNPDLGGYLVNRRPVKNPPVYVQDQDFLKSDVNVGTLRVKYNFSDNVRLSNIARYGDSNNGYVVTGARQATAIAAGTTPAYITASLSTHNYWQRVDYIANQTNLYIDSDLFGGKNQLIIGGEYTRHNVKSGSYSVTNTGAFNCRTSGTGAFNAYCAIGPNGQPVNGVATLLGRQITRNPIATREWKIETVSGYILDTVDITKALTLFGGVRLDHYKFKLDTFTNSAGTAGPAGTRTGHYPYKDTLWNGYAGITYKLGGGGMIYASIASAADINGGESDTGTSAGYGGLVLLSGQPAPANPERSVNLELGTKWNVFDERLLLTAAIFQTTKSDVMEGIAPPTTTGTGYDPTGYINSGRNRVRGVEVSVIGNVTPAWTVQGGFTIMESEVRASLVGVSSTVAVSPNIGKMLSNFAKRSAQVQTSYQFTDRVSLGAAFKYESRRYGGQPDTAAGFTTLADGSYLYSQPVPAYGVVDLFGHFGLTDDLDLRVNVNNLLDKDYYTAVYRSGSFLYKGDARTVRATLTYDF